MNNPIQTNPTVSIVIAIYNIQKFLQPCLDSVLQQTFDDYEVLLVNDGSTDQSKYICDNYAEKNQKFKVFNKINGGLASARNFGLMHAKGKYVYFMDGDDRISPFLLEENIKKISSYNAEVIVFGHTKEFLGNSNKKIESLPPNFYTKSHDEVLHHLIKLLNGGNGFAVWEQIYLREFLINSSITFPEFKRGSDMMFLLELYSNSCFIVTNSKSYYYYIEFGDSKKYDIDIINNHIKFYEKYLNLFGKKLEERDVRRYSLKLLLLWFCHVIPTNITNYNNFNRATKLLELKNLLHHQKLRSFIHIFSLRDTGFNPLAITMFTLLKLKSSLLLYYFTRLKSYFKNNYKINHKKLF